MPNQLEKLENILKASNLTFDRSLHDDNTELFSAVINAATDLRMDIIAMKDAEGYELKIIAWVDDVDMPSATNQLKQVLALNFILSLGRFAFQTDIDAIVYVADYPLGLLDEGTFQSILDEYLYFSNMYFENYYGGKKSGPGGAGGEEDRGEPRFEAMPGVKIEPGSGEGPD